MQIKGYQCYYLKYISVTFAPNFENLATKYSWYRGFY